MAATTVSIENLDKAELLVRLWEGAKSWRGQPSPTRMSLNEPLKISRRELLEGARRIVGGGHSLYVWHGRFIAVDIAKNEIDTTSTTRGTERAPPSALSHRCALNNKFFLENKKNGQRTR